MPSSSQSIGNANLSRIVGFACAYPLVIMYISGTITWHFAVSR